MTTTAHPLIQEFASDTSEPVLIQLSKEDVEVIMRSIVPFCAHKVEPEDTHLLTGVNLSINKGYLNAVGTDGSRLAHYRTLDPFNQADCSLVVSQDAFRALSKVWRKKTAGDIVIGSRIQLAGIYVTGTGLETSAKFEPFASQKLKGVYPHYEELFPSAGSIHIDLLPDKEAKNTGYDLGDIALDVSLINKNYPHAAMKLNFLSGDSAVTISLVERDWLPWQYKACSNALITGGNLEIYLNAAYFADALSSMTGGIQITADGLLKPIVITCLGTPGLRHLLMPIDTNVKPKNTRRKK